MGVLKKIALASAVLLTMGSTVFAAIEPTPDVAPEASVVVTEAPTTPVESTAVAPITAEPSALTTETPTAPAESVEVTPATSFPMGDDFRWSMGSDAMPRWLESDMSGLWALLALGMGAIVVIGIIVLALAVFYSYCQYTMAKKLDTPNAWMAFGWLIGIVTLPLFMFLGWLLGAANAAMAGIAIAIGAIPMLLPNFLLVLMSGKGSGFAFLVAFVLPGLVGLLPLVLGESSGAAVFIVIALQIISAIIGIYIFVLILNRRNRNGWMVLVLLFFYPIYFPILALRDVPPRI